MLGVTYRPPDSLKPHPLNATIYNTEPDDSAFRRSIAEKGILQPLTVDQYGTILSGHRRWKVACALALENVPVIEREITDPIEAERILIESNRQRIKTPSEVMREGENIERIVGEEALRRMLAGKVTDPPPMLEEGSRLDRETASQAAESVGMKRSTYRKVKRVYEAARGKRRVKGKGGDTIEVALPESVVVVAKQQMAALDAGDTTPHAAEKAVGEVEVREKVRAMPKPKAVADPFSNDPEVLAARRVKNARIALEATANNLTYYTPDEMADAVMAQGDRDIVSDDLDRLAQWIADYRRALARRRAGLSLVR